MIIYNFNLPSLFIIATASFSVYFSASFSLFAIVLTSSESLSRTNCLTHPSEIGKKTDSEFRRAVIGQSLRYYHTALVINVYIG